jgi:ABC-type transporter Mla subunit MlaD
VTRPRRRRRERHARRRVALGLVALLVFAVGIALGQALEDNPQHGRTITREQIVTLRPASTVTVTAP